MENSKNWAQVQPSTALGAHSATYIAVYLLGVVEGSVKAIFEERVRGPGDLGVGELRLHIYRRVL